MDSIKVKILSLFLKVFHKNTELIESMKINYFQDNLFFKDEICKKKMFSKIRWKHLMKLSNTFQLKFSNFQQMSYLHILFTNLSHKYYNTSRLEQGFRTSAFKFIP